MQYKEVFLENYKGIKNRLVFDLSLFLKEPLCIIGGNESGKTTILKGIELIGKLCSGYSLENGERNAIKPKGDYFSGVVRLGAKLIFEKNIISGNHALYKYLKDTQKNDIELEMIFSYEFKNASFLKNHVEMKFAESLIQTKEDSNNVHELIKTFAPEIIYYEDFKFTVPKTIRFLEQTNTNTNCANDSLLNSSQNQHWQKIFNDILKGHNKNADFQRDIVDWGDDLSQEQNIAKSRLNNMGIYLGTILSEWVKDLSNNNNNKIDRFEIMEKQSAEKDFNDYQISIVAGKNYYQMDERSKGLQWSFCFHILTKIRKNRHEAGVIFLLDEPANNLHIRPQGKMLQHLRDLCDTKSSVIYSTHAPELISINDGCYENIFIAKNNANEFQETDIHLIKLNDINNVANIKIDIEDLEPILANLAYEDVKRLGDLEANENDLKVIWSNAAKELSKGFSIITLDKMAKVSTIANFVLNSFGKYFQ